MTNGRLLLVDDEIELLRAHILFLERKGYEVVKTTNGLTMIVRDGAEVAEKKRTNCLRCGRCTTVCPTGLLPELMAEAARRKDYERYEKKLYGLECVACGSCSYICPAKRPLTETFKQVKAEIMAQKRAAQAGGKK